MWLTALLTFVVGYLGLLLLLGGCQRAFMYYPGAALPSPERAGFPPSTEAVTLRTEDGLELVAWFVPLAEAEYTALVFHGNAGTVADRRFLVDLWHAAGCSVLLVGYRGYGGNPGRPTERGLYRDALAAHAWAESREDVDASRLVYYGRSLGSGPATYLAAERPPAGLVLDAPFLSMADAAQHHYWYLPAKYLVLDRYDNLANIPRVTCPVLVVVPENDRIVPPSHGKRLYEAAPGLKRLRLQPGAGHNDNVEADFPGYVRELREFVEQVVGPARKSE